MFRLKYDFYFSYKPSKKKSLLLLETLISPKPVPPTMPTEWTQLTYARHDNYWSRSNANEICTELSTQFQNAMRLNFYRDAGREVQDAHIQLLAHNIHYLLTWLQKHFKEIHEEVPLVETWRRAVMKKHSRGDIDYVENNLAGEYSDQLTKMATGIESSLSSLLGNLGHFQFHQIDVYLSLIVLWCNYFFKNQDKLDAWKRIALAEQ